MIHHEINTHDIQQFLVFLLIYFQRKRQYSEELYSAADPGFSGGVFG